MYYDLTKRRIVAMFFFFTAKSKVDNDYQITFWEESEKSPVWGYLEDHYLFQRKQNSLSC